MQLTSDSDILAYSNYLDTITREPYLAMVTEYAAKQIEKTFVQLYVKNSASPLGHKAVKDALRSAVNSALPDAFQQIAAYCAADPNIIEIKCVERSRYKNLDDFASDLYEFLLGRSNRFMNRAYSNIERFRNNRHQYNLRTEVLDTLHKRITRWRIKNQVYFKNLDL